jgi:hypothetical protein
MVFLRFDVGTNTQKFTEIPNRKFAAPTQTVNFQLLTLRTKASSGSAGITVQTSRPKTKAIDCLNQETLLCLSVAPQTVNEKQSLLITATVAFMERNNQRQFSYHVATTLDSPHEITLKISGSWFQLYVDRQFREQYRYGLPLGISIETASLNTKVFGENYQGSMSNEFVFTTRQEYLPSIILFVISLLTLMIYLMHYLISLSTKKSTDGSAEIFLPIVTLSSFISLTSWLICQGSLVKNKSPFPTSGISYGSLPKFGDFFQVWGLPAFKNLYQTQHPDYPPAIILAVSILSKAIVSEAAFVIIICCSTATLGALIWGNVRNNLRYPTLVSMFFTFTSAPLLYAIDRGGTDMILFPLIVLTVLLYSNTRIKSATMLISVATTLKIRPGMYLLMLFGRGKSIRKVFQVLGATIFLNFVAAMLLPEKNISEIWLYLKNLLGRSSGGTVTNAYDVFNNSLWSSFRGLNLALTYFGVNTSRYLNTTWLICIFFLLIFSIYWSLCRSQLSSSKFFIANCILLLVPTLAPNYRLLFMYPALWYLSNTIIFPSLHLKRTFVVVAAFLLSVSPIYYFGSTGINIGQAVKPFLILTLLLIVCYSDGYHKDKFSNQEPREDAVIR